MDAHRFYEAIAMHVIDIEQLNRIAGGKSTIKPVQMEPPSFPPPSPPAQPEPWQPPQVPPILPFPWIH
jgi:hypothetical protein